MTEGPTNAENVLNFTMSSKRGCGLCVNPDAIFHELNLVWLGANAQPRFVARTSFGQQFVILPNQLLALRSDMQLRCQLVLFVRLLHLLGNQPRRCLMRYASNRIVD